MQLQASIHINYPGKSLGEMSQLSSCGIFLTISVCEAVLLRLVESWKQHLDNGQTVGSVMCFNILDFHLFADDTNLFLNNSNILNLEAKLNVELEKVSQWLYADKLSLNIEKTSFVVFHLRISNMYLRIKLNI